MTARWRPPIAAQLYLPQSWTQDAARRAEVGVPEEIAFRSKPELARALIRQVQADTAPPAPVLGESVYSDSPTFRAGVRQLGMEFFLQVSLTHKAWPHPVATEQKRVRHHVDPQTAPAQTLAEQVGAIPPSQWRTGSWRGARGRTRKTRLAWGEVYLQPPRRQGQGGMERVWLVVDWPAGESQPYRYYLAHLHPPLPGHAA